MNKNQSQIRSFIGKRDEAMKKIVTNEMAKISHKSNIRLNAST